ncbi:MAG: Asp-tRNA(Asn)/Glu-tRNA(Gln) amidotransferase subunit GatC [Chlamydiae bacterium]|nr:Asp-tRNA(Asn)/Glu-tRNA(Gln) amidotransferase subunit GatC [Chlamydiota bacterium]
MQQFTKEDLHKLKTLCHIECTPEEEERLLRNMQSILEYIEKLHEVNTELTMGRHNPLEGPTNVMGEDIPEEPLERDIFLSNAPSQVGGMVKIPPVM